MNWRRILIIAGIVVIIGIVGFLVYYFVFRPPVAPIAPPPPTAFPPINVPVGLPPAIEREPVAVSPEEAVQVVPPELLLPPEVPPPSIADFATGGLTRVSQVNNIRTAGVTLASDGANLNFYNRDTGQFYQVTPDGEMKLLTDRIFRQVENIVWSPNKNETILEFPDGSNVLFNMATDQVITLPRHWEEFSFSGNGAKIAAKSLAADPEDRWLIVSNPDGSSARLIEPLGDNADRVDVDWSPNNQVIATFTESIDFDRQELYFVGQNDENFKLTVLNGRGFEGQWAPQGDRLLYSVYNSETDFNPQLWIVDARGENIGNNRKPLNIRTWADKCAFSSDNINLICGVPTQLPTGAGIIPSVANDISDVIVRINTQTGSVALAALTDKDYTVKDPVLSADESKLYFLNQFDQLIYSVNLK
ncbi:MAG TPA: WD40 repeat domain-containing protein [Patescibacteria group bacterium]